MMRPWTRTGPDYRVRWGEQDWTLRVDAPRPGLYADGAGPLLGLDGLAAPGRRDRAALGAASLTGHECRFQRVTATYEPPGWSELTVRATWTPSGDAAIDLEVQVHAQSVGALRRFEVLAVNSLAAPDAAPRSRVVFPRDARCAALSYDGREDDLGNLITHPPGGLAGRVPWIGQLPSRDDLCYVALAHPDDESRRLIEGAGPVRHALFGHDLEKGVVLRARLRGLWIPNSPPWRLAMRAFEQFVREPPPLTTG